MKVIRALCCVVAFVLSATYGQEASRPAGSVDQLVGLWKGKERYGPDARGPLVIQKNGNSYIADMIGRMTTVQVRDDEFSFELPNKQGSFRGKREEKDIVGHWIQPGTIANGFGYTMVTATPVVLMSTGPDRWSGIVDPVQDEATIYLLIEKNLDGSLRALVRNPERDFGNQMRIDRLTREGDVIKLFGSRGQTPNVEWASGGFSAEDNLMTLYFPSRGLNFVMVRDDDDSSMYPRGKKPAQYNYRPPIARDDGWATGSLDDADIDRAGLEKAIQTIIDTPETAPDTPQLQGIVIIRHGKLVLDEYFRGFSRDMLHNTRSASKSMTATIIGAAMQAGAPLKVSSSVYQIMNGGKIPADLEPGKQAMTLENLLTMSSGIFCDDNNENAPGQESRMWEQTEEPNFYRRYLSLPMDRKPGEKSVYCSNDPNLALAVLGRATGEYQLRTFDRLLTGPMKIKRYGWALDRAGNPYGGGGAAFTLRDFAKFGQLMLDGGVWQGRRILSREWVTRATSPVTSIGSRKYGYLWWVGDYPYKDRKVNVFWALGAGGQNITVIPELDLVIATFSGSYATRSYGYATGELIPRLILPTVNETRHKKVRSELLKRPSSTGIAGGNSKIKKGFRRSLPK